MRIVSTGICEVGLNRQVNQDSVLIKAGDNCGLFAVADGMGGHSRGEFASSTITKNLDEWWNDFSTEKYANDFSRMIVSLRQILEKANGDIFSSSAEGETCGSTVVVLFICNGLYGVLYAGDSRVYLKRSNAVRQLTIDETWENKSELTLGKREMRLHPNYGKLLNAVGISNDLKIVTQTDKLPEDFVFALCSDGVYKYCRERTLYRYLKRSNVKVLEQTLDIIRKNVYINGAGDNLSLVLVGGYSEK